MNTLRESEFVKTIRRESKELGDFYIDKKRKERLESMGRFKRTIFFTWWLLKSMFSKLSRVRRLLVLFGIFFNLNSCTIKYGSAVVSDNGFLGGAMILFVLLLELKDKLLAQDELEAGRKIQNALMPERSPHVPGWSLWLFTRPANEVGGDLVDFLRADDRRYAVIMADVAGKGLRAALFTAKLQATIRALASEYTDPAKLCGKVNVIFHRDGLPNMFASLLYIEIQAESGDLHFVNAGHLPPIAISGDANVELPKGEMAIGLSKQAHYTEQHRTLQSGDVFFAYSDGLTEACNEAGEYYGTERLHTLMSRLRRMSASAIGETVVEEIARFAGEAPASDDLSILVLKKA